MGNQHTKLTWEGFWSSKMNQNISGMITADLPRHLAVLIHHSPIAVQAFVQYDETSTFRPGYICSLQFQVDVSKISETKSSQGSANLSMHSNGVQRITYSAPLPSLNTTEIRGTYQSQHPTDYGNFTLARIKK